MRLTSLVFFSILAVSSFANDWLRVSTFGGQSQEFFTCVESDANGNIYVGGNYDGEFNLGLTKLVCKGGIDGFVAKFSPEFKLIWVVRVSNSDTIAVSDIVLDNKGNLFVGGHYQSQFEVIKGMSSSRFSNPASSKHSDMYALKLDSLGNLVEGFMANGATDNHLNEIYYSESGYVLLAGYQTDALNKKDGLLVGSSLNKKNSWKQTMEGAGDEEYVSVVQHQQGDLIALGNFKSAADFDGGSVTKMANGDAMAFGIYSLNGRFKDAIIRDEGSPRGDRMLVVRGDIHVGGTHTGTLEHHKDLTNDPFVLSLRYDDSSRVLTPRWSNYVSASGPCTVTSMSASTDNFEIVIGGQMIGELKSYWDSIPFVELERSFTATFDNKPGKPYIRLLATESDDARDIVRGITTYNDGFLLVGAYQDTVQFDDTSTVSSGKYDAYAAFFDEYELFLRTDSFNICRDSAQLDSTNISFYVSGPFKKANKFMLELSGSPDFNSFTSQEVFRNQGNRFFYFPDSLRFKTYYVRLTSSKPRLVSEGRRLFKIMKSPTKPTIVGPDTLTVKDTFHFSSTNLDADRRSSSWGAFTSHRIIGNRYDTTAAFVFSSTGESTIYTRVHDNYCSSEAALKKVVIAPEHRLSIDPRSALKCEGDTMQWMLYSNGYFKPSNKFILIADSSKGQSAPIIIDTVKWKPNLFYDNQTFVFDLSPLPPGKFNIIITSTEPQKSSFNGINHYGPVVTINSQPLRPEIDGRIEVEQSKTYTYKAKGDPSIKYFWSISDGNILNGQETSSVDVEWNKPGNGELRVYGQQGACKGEEDTLVVDIVSSVNPIVEDFDLYPNPANDRIFIRLPRNGELTVFTMDGRIAIETIELPGGESSVDLSTLKPGSYMIQLLTKHSSQTVLWQIE